MSRQVRKILFLAANPKNSNPLRLDEEIREIELGLRRARLREQFELEQRWAVRPRDLQRALLEVKPQIIHFSGHGTGEEGLVLEDELAHPKLVLAKALSELFQLFSGHIECVLLNACYSSFQAEVIVNHISYVIGMSQEIKDKSALEFAIGFYDALGAGESIEFAYKYGCNSIHLTGIEEHLIPILKKKSSNSNNSLTELTNLDNPRGIIDINSPFYLERPPIEQICYQTIIQPRAFIRIKAPWQMGKSSLMIRILHYASQKSHRTMTLNLQEVESKIFMNYDKFLYWFCYKITEKLNLHEKLENELEKYWNKNNFLGLNGICTRYIQKLIYEIDEPLVIAIDELDLIYQNLILAKDFLSLLRAWNHLTNISGKLKFIIVHCQDINLLGDNNSSPFNIGTTIELTEFNQEQIIDLTTRYNLNLSDKEVKKIINIIGGHPYLVKKAFYELKQQKLTFKIFLQKLLKGEFFSDHLYCLLSFLENNIDLKENMKIIVNSTLPISLNSINTSLKLKSLGLIKINGNCCEPFCNLYRQFFQIHLVS